jgi:hypothetical protein
MISAMARWRESGGGRFSASADFLPSQSSVANCQMSKCCRESGGDKFSASAEILSVQLLIVCCVIPANAGYSLPMISAMARWLWLNSAARTRAAGEIGRIEITSLQLAANPAEHAIADLADTGKTRRDGLKEA